MCFQHTYQFLLIHLCPVSAILNYLTVQPAGPGSLFVLIVGYTFINFVKNARAALKEARGTLPVVFVF